MRKESRMFHIEEELKKLPSLPGVYIMHDEQDAIIYVGKGNQSEKQGQTIFSEKQKSGN